MKPIFCLLFSILFAGCSVGDSDPDVIKPLFFGEATTAPAVATPTAPVSVSSGLVAYYSFGGNASDASGNANNGIVNGATLATDRKGITNAAYSFGGFNNSNNIKIPNSTSLFLGQELTLSVWLNLLSYSGMDGYGNLTNYGLQTIIAKDGDLGGFYMTISGDASRDKAVLNFTNPPVDVRTELPGNLQMNLKQWIHISVVVSKGIIKLYYNGVLIKSQSLTTPIDFSKANSKNLYIGRFGITGGYAPTGWYPFNGRLDEIRVYNRALTDAEVQIIANQ